VAVRSSGRSDPQGEGPASSHLGLGDGHTNRFDEVLRAAHAPTHQGMTLAQWCSGRRRARRCNSPVEAWNRPLSRDSRAPSPRAAPVPWCLRSVRNGQARPLPARR
jgi:hypothetical protein